MASNTRRVTPRPKVKTTNMQERLAHVMAQEIANPTNKTKKQMLIDAGYSEQTADKQPDNMMQAIGVQIHLERLGMSRAAADSRLLEILHNGQESNSLRALDIYYRLTGAYIPTRHERLIVNAQLVKPSEDTTKLIVEFEKQLRAKLVGN